VLVSLVNFWTEIKFLQMLGTCRTSKSLKLKDGEMSLDIPTCLTESPTPLPILI
jgi:hypothetical protein